MFIRSYTLCLQLKCHLLSEFHIREAKQYTYVLCIVAMISTPCFYLTLMSQSVKTEEEGFI